ncbi:hypothetical protein LOD99_16067 [Oopsacas minuta]|uniref:Protein kinase domain-containing protein n=1 Tax=Oopsacas minuta TaxID=111878 RepID=A0AAV7K8A6_9METZ|nr:hypothetical protein LOD99_16067 [Oopsacas minuta]
MLNRNVHFDVSKSESFLQLSKYKFPSLQDSATEDSINESSDETKIIENTDIPNSEGNNETFNVVSESVDSLKSKSNLSLMSHPLCNSTPGPSRHPFPLTPQISATPNLFSTHPCLAKESTAPAGLSQANWPPLLLRPVLVNNTPYYTMGELGRGSTSTVQRVVDLNWRFYALKSVNLEDIDQLQLDSYQNEILVLQNLRDNSHVIHLFDFEFSPINKKLYIVMECGQLDLARIIKDNNNQPFETYHIQTYWHDMLKGVTAIHSMDIIHTDLKPNNFVLVNTKLKIIDFGIACSLNNDATSFEREGRWGTPNYMAPEMILSIPKNGSLPSQGGVCKISQSADVWSLGCILYKLAYGITPFQHIGDKIKKWIAITDPNEVISFPKDISESLLPVLISCLDRNPRKRPTCLQLLANKFLNC